MPDPRPEPGPERNLERDILYALTGLGVPPAALDSSRGLPRLTLGELTRLLDEPDLADDVARLERVGLIDRGSDGRLSASPGAVRFAELIGSYVV